MFASFLESVQATLPWALVCSQNLPYTASFPAWGWGTVCVSLPSLFICGALWPWLRTGWLQGPAGLPHLSLFSTWPVTWWDGSRAVPDPHTSCQAWHFCEITHRSACILFSKTTHRSRHRFETSAVVQLVGSIFISICDKTFWREIENFLTFEVIHLK